MKETNKDRIEERHWIAFDFLLFRRFQSFVSLREMGRIKVVNGILKLMVKWSHIRVYKDFHVYDDIAINIQAGVPSCLQRQQKIHSKFNIYQKQKIRNQYSDPANA